MSKGDVEHSSLDIKLSRFDRTYRPGETVNGTIIIGAKGGWAHSGIKLFVVGQASLQVSARSVGLFDSMTNLKPLGLMNERYVVCEPGKVKDGITEVPFDFELPRSSSLQESYHGVYINVKYNIICECERGVMKKGLHKETEFIVEVSKGQAPPKPKDVTFTLTPDSLKNVSASALASVPKFKISGRLFNTAYAVNMPFTGEVVIEEAETPISSIELQLVRVETVKHPDTGNTVREATEVQNVQIADGDVARNMVVPMYMIFPRLFSCPTMITDNFQIEFEVNLVVIFDDGYVVTERFPVSLFRSQR